MPKGSPFDRVRLSGVRQSKIYTSLLGSKGVNARETGINLGCLDQMRWHGLSLDRLNTLELKILHVYQ